MWQPTNDCGVSEASTASTTEWHVKAFGALLGGRFSERQKGREGAGRSCKLPRGSSILSARHTQPEAPSQVHIRTKHAGKGQEEVKALGQNGDTNRRKWQQDNTQMCLIALGQGCRPGGSKRWQASKAKRLEGQKQKVAGKQS